MKHIIITICLTITTLWAQIPAGYYDSAEGLLGTTLQHALHDIIDDHVQQTYGSLHTHYYSTDRKPDDTVWDMYSDIPGGTPPYTFNFNNGETCGNYSGEGDCYNREHSWPKSWFNEGDPMYSDLYHVVPSDGYVNGQRGNYPYGEVNSPTWTSLNGSKRGPNSYPGYSGTVFEPIDAYKGDFARIYFYMSARYLNEDAGWTGSPMVDGAQLQPWALSMMMDWHAADPVSQKEIDRNDAVYAIQQNRNPFVDHPEYVDLVWGDPPVLPAMPSDLVASDITDTTLVLSWSDNSEDETGFYVYQDNQRVATLAVNSTSQMIEQLEPGSTYGFAVSAFNDDGESQRATITVSTPGGGGDPVTHFSEDFESGSGSSYIEGEFTLDSGTWSAYQAGNFTLGTPRSGSKSIALNDDKPGAHITTPAVNTVGSVSFYYYQRNGAAEDEFRLEKSMNGAAFELVSVHNYAVGENYTLFTATLDDTSSSVRVRIVNDDQTGHLIIDDLTLTQFEPVSVEDKFLHLPLRAKLLPAYPNPFNPEVRLSFELPGHTEQATLNIFNLRGEWVATPVKGELSAGFYTVVWDGTNAFGEVQTSGVYLVRLNTNQGSDLQRITLLR